MGFEDDAGASRSAQSRKTARYARTSRSIDTSRTQTSRSLSRSTKQTRSAKLSKATRPSINASSSKSRSVSSSRDLGQEPIALERGVESTEGELVSTSVGDMRREERAERLRKSSRRYLMRAIAIAGVLVALLGGWAALYNSPAFSITNVQVNGVEHLTSDEMAQLANVPADTTLLRVDTDTIASRVLQSSWVESVKVNRVFPDTLEINVTERTVLAVVEMPNESGTSTKRWAIAPDRLWLMPIPDASSEAAQTTSAKIYEDAENAVQIVGLPFGTQAEIGKPCTDLVVNNALDILLEMTTELSDRVVKISAASIAETSLFLDNGMEIAFGDAEDIRDKERTILRIMEEYPDGVAYINVRIVDNPTWRSI